MDFAVGSLVRARGREWVVLPDSLDEEDMLVLRPLGGTEAEETGICTLLEEVTEATFPKPNPDKELGNHNSCRLLRDAVRLGFRSGAGPFRSLAKIGVEPRPYQLVPLLMALRLDPIRLLIADDVGIGKTVEACLIARELLDRGEIKRVAVLCPPHLAEQWQLALRDQFHIDAALVLSGTAARLERDLALDQTIFDKYPFVVISTDYIKQKDRRFEFIRVCPEFVIVDEAHTCSDAMGRGASQLRHDLLKALVRDENRHLLLVTATPHSGKEETFRSLLGLLNTKFLDLPADLSGDKNRKHREFMAKHYVQRRRGDLKAYMDVETPFPAREIKEEHYSLHPDYRKVFTKVLDYCRETVQDETLDKRRQRVRWWSALALLRSLGSSPKAAAATLRNRSAGADAKTQEQADDEGRRAVLDLDDETAEGMDVVPGSQFDDDEKGKARRRLLGLAKEVELLAGKKDHKLRDAAKITKKLLKDGFSPILFCRFIPTVEYVAKELQKKLGKKVHVEAITGSLPPAERIRRIEDLDQYEQKVLVCTDCLSEGINLQSHFDAVVHYDLSWNPTRHEQREGRVDRYGGAPKVRTLTYYGGDNPVDGIVLEVLLRKHKAIHKQLGIVVPVPMDTNVVVEAIFESLLMRESAGNDAKQTLLWDFVAPEKKEVADQWDAAVDREKRSRNIFAQRSIKVDEVATEVAEIRRALGGEADIERFTLTGFEMLKAQVGSGTPVLVDLTEASPALRDAVGEAKKLKVVFGKAVPGAILLGRTHPIVEGLAAHVLETALDADLEGPGKRCGVISTNDVKTRTTVMLLRLRFHIVNKDRSGVERPLLAEDVALVGFTGSAKKAKWLAEEDLEPLLAAKPHADLPVESRRSHMHRILDDAEALQEHLREIATARADELLKAHRRVRKAAKTGVRALKVELAGEPDVLGAFLYLPAGGAA
jgi:superfamily II DNA or RNA helicase